MLDNNLARLKQRFPSGDGMGWGGVESNSLPQLKPTHRVEPEFDYWRVIKRVKLSCDGKPLRFDHALHIVLPVRMIQDPDFFEHFLRLKQHG